MLEARRAKSFDSPAGADQVAGVSENALACHGRECVFLCTFWGMS